MSLKDYLCRHLMHCLLLLWMKRLSVRQRL